MFREAFATVGSSLLVRTLTCIHGSSLRVGIGLVKVLVESKLQSAGLGEGLAALDTLRGL